MLGGVTRMTISITVLVMEGTAAMQLIVPLMFAVFVAKMVGDSLTPSIYDVHIKIRGAPVLVSGPYNLFWTIQTPSSWLFPVTRSNDVCQGSAYLVYQYQLPGSATACETLPLG